MNRWLVLVTVLLAGPSAADQVWGRYPGVHSSPFYNGVSCDGQNHSILFGVPTTAPGGAYLTSVELSLLPSPTQADVLQIYAQRNSDGMMVLWRMWPGPSYPGPQRFTWDGQYLWLPVGDGLTLVVSCHGGGAAMAAGVFVWWMA